MDPRGDQHLGAVGQQPGLLGDAATAWTSPSYGALPVQPVLAVVVAAARAPRRAARPTHCVRPWCRASARLRVADTRVTRPSASATTTPVGQQRRQRQRGTVGVVGREHHRSGEPPRSAALGPGARVEADRGGGRQVEALGAAVDRDPDPVVGERRPARPAGPRASLPNSQAVGPREQVVGASSRSTSPAPSAASTCSPAACAARTAAAGSGSTATGGGTGCRRWPGRSWGCRRRPSRRRARRRRRPRRRRMRMTVPALPGSRTSAQIASEPCRRRASTSRPAAGRGTGRPRPRPAGVTVSLSAASARSSTSGPGSGAGAAPGRRTARSAAGVAKTSTHAAGHAERPSTACGPSARNSRRSARTERRLSFRASLTRALPRGQGRGCTCGSVLRPRPCGRVDVLGQRGLGGLDQRVERGGVVDGEVGEDLAVDLDAGQA